jgi:hypothetical protein
VLDAAPALTAAAVLKSQCPDIFTLHSH